MNVWTPEEDERLKKLFEANTSVHLVAAKLKRSVSAVRGRASFLKVSVKRSPLFAAKRSDERSKVPWAQVGHVTEQGR
jgi:hypothetical protein